MKIREADIIFRRAKLKDIKELVNLRMEFLTSTFKVPKKEELIEIKVQIQKYLGDTISTNKFVSWVAEHDGKIIATSALTIWESLSSFSIKTGLRGRILNMYTIPEARNMGIGSKLFDKLIKDGKKLGVSGFSLDATKDGINIYKKKGFLEPENPELVYFP